MKNLTIQLAFITLLATNIASADAPNQKQKRSRQQFVEAMNKIRKGMSQEQVVALLGRPDDIRTHLDPGGIGPGVKEIWRYGTSGHLTTPTLGQVYIDKNERVQYIVGQGTPPPPGLFQEAHLRKLLRALDNAPSYHLVEDYNPGKLIRAVNFLQPLGKKRALAAIQEYLRIADDRPDNSGRQGTLLVLRVLFDVPKVPSIAWPPRLKYEKLFPQFPLIVEGDIPFLLVGVGWLRGALVQPEDQLGYFQKHGTIRQKPLNPTAKPFAALTKLMKSPHWESLKKDVEKRILDQQLLRMMDTVYRVEPNARNELLPYGAKYAEKRKKIIQAAASLNTRWDSKLNQYTFLNGKTLPPGPRKIYRRSFWNPKEPNLDVQIVVERHNRHYISITVSETVDKRAQPPLAIFRVFNVNSKNKSLYKFRSGGLVGKNDGPGSGGVTLAYHGMELTEGVRIQIELTIGKKRQFSPIIEP